MALKASAGSSESISILSVDNIGAFVDITSRNGWKFYAAVAPLTSKTPSSAQSPKSSMSAAKYLSIGDLQNPLTKHPCVIMLGGEGDGLAWNLRRKANYELGIEGRRPGEGGVDSLNVSVAGALLCEAFLRGYSDKSLQDDKVAEERLF